MSGIAKAVLFSLLILTTGCSVSSDGTVSGNPDLPTPPQPQPAKMALKTDPINFGDIRIGSSKSDFITISNSGDLDLVIDFSYLGSDYFSIDPSSSCNSDKTLSKGEKCNISIKYAPLTAGNFSGILNVKSVTEGVEYNINMAGTASDNPNPNPNPDPDPEPNPDPGYVNGTNFGRTAKGSFNEQAVIFINRSSTEKRIADIKITGTTSFIVTDKSDCIKAIPQNGSCTAKVKFGPSTDNAHNGIIYLESDSGEAVSAMPLSGVSIDNVIMNSHPVARAMHSASVIGDKIYIFGGNGGTLNNEKLLNDFWVYDTKTGLWREIFATGKIPSTRYWHSSTVMGGKIYIFGGVTAGQYGDVVTKELYIYDPATNIWTDITPADSELNIDGLAAHSATLLTDKDGVEKMYIFSGRKSVSTSDKMYVFNPTDNSWRSFSISGHLKDRFYSTAVSIGNKMYIYGGKDELTMKDLNELWVYDPILDQWEQISDSPNSPGVMSFHTASAIGDKMYVFGGDKNKSYIYDTVSKQWSNKLLDASNDARFGHSASVIGDNIYLFGGQYAVNSKSTRDVLSRYTVTLNHLEIIERVLEPKADFYSLASIGKYIYLNTDESELWKYDTMYYRWSKITPIGATPDQRYNNAIVALKGKLYIFGGKSSTANNEFNDFWVYDPADNKWSNIAAPITIENRYSAVLLTDGTDIFLTGGENSNGKKFNDVWQYKTADNQWVLKAAQSSAADAPKVLLNSAVIIDGAIYTYNNDGVSTMLYNDLIYKMPLSTGKWEIVTISGDKPSMRAQSSSTESGGKYYIFGGIGNNSPATAINDIWSFNPVSGKWMQAVAAGTQHTDKSIADDNHAVTVGETIWLYDGTRQNMAQYFR